MDIYRVKADKAHKRMQTTTTQQNGHTVALVQSDEALITDVQSALDFIATVRYETGADRVAIRKEAVTEDFFELRTGLAGEILQKFVSYHMRLAIIGDFSRYTSKALRDFIYESNRGGHIFFAAGEQGAADMLCRDRL